MNNNNNLNVNQLEDLRIARDALKNELVGIPGAEDIFESIVFDWQNNVVVDDLNEMTAAHIKETIESMYEGENPPEIDNQQYEHITDAFKRYIRRRAEVIGDENNNNNNNNMNGGRRRKSKSKRRHTKKVTKSKKAKHTRRR